MNNNYRFRVIKVYLGLFLIIILTGALPAVLNAGSLTDKVNTNLFGVAIKGYDTVAYFTEGRAVKGKSKFSHYWSDAKWYFSSEENRDLFIADPEKYAPQYGGYWAGNLATTGKVAGVNPKNFKIINEKLYLSWDAEGSDTLAKKADEYVQKADKNWLMLNEKK